MVSPIVHRLQCHSIHAQVVSLPSVGEDSFMDTRFESKQFLCSIDHIIQGSSFHSRYVKHYMCTLIYFLRILALDEAFDIGTA